MRLTRKKLTKKMSMLILLIVLISSTFAISVLAEEPSGVKGDTCYTHGDVNTDGRLTSKDPIQLLYTSVLGDGESSAEQSLDFNGDGTVDISDAIHLLYSIDGLFGDILPQYKLNGVIHAYGEPIWNWDMEGDIPVVTATFQCACQKGARGVVSAEVKLDADLAPTCTEAGSKTYTAAATFNDVTYETSKTVIIDATGHSYAEESVPCTERTCRNEGCGYIEKAAAHNFGTPVHKDATCTEAATDTYTCTDCGYSYVEIIGNALGHTLDPETLVETLYDSAACEYVQEYRCSVCDATIEGEHVHKHAYTAAITKEATCTEAGTKTYTCANCGTTYTEEIPKNADAHAWDEGTVATETGITTYACTRNGCSATKTTVNASAETSTSMAKDILSVAEEVELNGASIKLDETILKQLDAEVSISAATVEKDDLQITEAQKDQIGSNPVYDFSIQSGGTTVSDFGEGTATVTLPYTLQDGDDVDCIDVWFIDDDGTVEIVKGTYSNGYVTFTTNHFSYYTVTRLTPAERCAAYGHSDAETVIAPTCEASGYTLHVCTRCTQTWKSDDKPCLEHNYEITTTEATCEEDGCITAVCNNCGDERETVLPKTGHHWVADGEGIQASCSQPGQQAYWCEKCRETKTELYAQLPHDLTETVIEPTCEAKGYTLKKCQNCDYEVIENETDALGHAFMPEWNWTVEGGNVSAVVTLTCENDEGHSVQRNAVIDIKKQAEPTCSKDGSTIYTAVVSYNQEQYTDEYEVKEAMTGHKPADEWKYDSANHYHVCTLCGGKVDPEEHALDDGTVTAEATCTTEGVRIRACKCGYKEEEAIPALGHEIQDGKCVRCDFTVNECTHEHFHEVVVELTEADGVCPGTITYETCECGQEKHQLAWDLGCQWERVTEVSKDANGYVQVKETNTCRNCGAVRSFEWTWEITGECEGTSYYQFTLSNGEQTPIFEFLEVYEEIQHPTAVYVEETDLSQYGLCGGSAVVTSCLCGQNREVVLTDNACEWVYDAENSGTEKYVEYCPVCGIEKIYTWRELEKSGCQVKVETLYTFRKNGQTVVEFDGQYTSEEHNFVEKGVLDNPDGSCLDGFTVTQTCSDCRLVNEWHENGNYHRMLDEKTVDLSDYEGCGGTIVSRVCLCGEESYVEENITCSMEFDSYNEEETEDGIIETETYICPDCGLKRQEISILRPTVYECTLEGEITTSYWMGEEKLLEITAHGTRHSGRYTECIDYKLNGETCEDGVTLIEECALCSEVFESYCTDHHWFTKERYHLADYGMCGGELTVEGCACGQESGIYEQDADGCQWAYWGYDEESGTDIYKCQTCGMMRHMSFSTNDIGGCKREHMERYEYLKGYQVVLSVETVSERDNHDLIYSFELDKDGGTCADGYTVYESCRKCDYQNSWHNKTQYHNNYCTEVIELAEYGFCGGQLRHSECPCGTEEFWYRSYGEDSCQWEWSYYDSEADATWYQCSVCKGFYSESTQTLGADGCRENIQKTYTFYDKDKVEKLSVQWIESSENHQYFHTFDLQGTTCSEGYTVTATCQKCGDTYSWTSSALEGEHNTYTTAIYNLGEKGFCGGTINLWECPCGESSGMYWNIHECCNFAWSTDETTGDTLYECTQCHGTYTVSYREEPIDTCHWNSIQNYTFRNSNGEEVACFEVAYPQESHNYTYTFELNGDSCSDGYVVKSVCSACDTTSERYESGHVSYLLETVELDGFCESLDIYGCACGENRNYYTRSSCTWDWDGYDDNTNTTTWTCTECGNKKLTTYTEGEKDSQCAVPANEHIAYVNQAGETVYEYDHFWTYTEHAYIYTYEMLGSTCEDGYYATAVCQDCGNSSQESLQMEHWVRTVERVNLGEMGLCGGELIRYSCACGKEESWGYVENCIWEYNSEPDNTERWICSVCGAVKERSCVSQEIDSCHINDVYETTYSKDGIVLYTYAEEYIRETHNLELLRYELDGSSCEDGFTAYFQCKACNQEIVETGSYHSTQLAEEYDLSQYGACDGAMISRYSCFCGEQQHLEYHLQDACDLTDTWNSYVDEAGLKHQVRVSTCSTCGLRVSSDTTSVRDVQTCTENITEVVTITIGSTAVDAMTLIGRVSSHDYEYTTSLAEGATSCEDGVRGTATCKNCGDSFDFSTSSHDMYEVSGSREDLSQYGSVCGGYVVQESCACGQRSQLTIKDAACDFDEQYENAWLGEDLPDQETTEGYFYPSRNGFIRTCAVTDPVQCGFAIRGCDYYVWDKENCCVTGYTTWQLGYDKETGTCQKEITIPTNSQMYHDYEEVTNQGTSDLGTTSIRTQTCKVCGSTHVETNTYDADGNCIRREAVSTNTLDNGKAKSRTEVDEWIIYQGDQYVLLSECHTTKADDTESWNKSEYIYDWDNFDCTRTRRDSDSNGGSWEYQEVCHMNEWDFEYGTCTQYGRATVTCRVCGEVTDQYPINPEGHSWYYDDAKAVYVCSRCGLENANGANGQIVIEDLTAEYGENDTSYVAGYWNREGVQYSYYLSVICNEIEEGTEGHEIILSGIDFTEKTRKNDGINAIAFRQDAAKAAATAAVAEAGYTGSYDLRFTFVPVGSDGSFDYAITFTNAQ